MVAKEKGKQFGRPKSATLSDEELDIIKQWVQKEIETKETMTKLKLKKSFTDNVELRSILPNEEENKGMRL